MRINTLGPLNNALNMVFAATVKRVNVDASLLFQLKERSAGHHLVKRLSIYFKSKLMISVILKSGAVYDCSNIFVFS